jgi:hypothetical protein
MNIINGFRIKNGYSKKILKMNSLENEYANRGVTEIVFQTVGSGDNEEVTIDNLNNIVETFGR